jgi:hypothetical protein
MKRAQLLFGLLLLTSGFQNAYAGDVLRPIRIPTPPIIMPPREIACAEALKPYFNWASGVTAAPEDRRSIVFTSVFNQNKNTSSKTTDSKPNLVGYSTGGLVYQGGSLVGDVRSFFSDRTFCMGNGSGFCIDAFPFNPQATDVANITIRPDGTMTTVLKSWGNATFQDTLVCYNNGVLFVPPKVGQRAMSVVTLQKTGFQTPR